jgi:flagellar hook protein FlgE
MDGEGFFICNTGVTDRYTRDGTFQVDEQNYLVDPATGWRVQRTNTTGEDEGFQVFGDNGIKVPYDSVLPGTATALITFKGNLSADELDPTATKWKGAGAVYNDSVTGELADVTSDLTNVTELGLQAGDTIDIAGTMADGSTATGASFTYTGAPGGQTFQDLLDTIETAFDPGTGSEVTAELKDGVIYVTENNTGYSLMTVQLSAGAGNTGPTEMPTLWNYVTVGGQAEQTTNITVYDDQGSPHALTMAFVRQPGDPSIPGSENVWDLVIKECQGAVNFDPLLGGSRRVAGIEFDETGLITNVTGADGFPLTSTFIGTWLDNLAVNFDPMQQPSPLQMAVEFGARGSTTGVTQFGGASSAGARQQDGFAEGSLESVSIDPTGTMSGVWTNGQSRDIAAVAVAVFQNTHGLERIGSNYWAWTPIAGEVAVGGGQENRAGRVRQNVLEESNVDISKEFSDMLIAQRGFQMNSRTIRVANNLIQTLVNIV